MVLKSAVLPRILSCPAVQVLSHGSGDILDSMNTREENMLLFDHKRRIIGEPDYVNATSISFSAEGKLVSCRRPRAGISLCFSHAIEPS